MKKQIKYIKAPFHFQLSEDITYQIKFISPYEEIDTWYCNFKPDGELTVKEGWAWDGASGPTIDTKNTIRASCCHDVLAKLMRNGYLRPGLWRHADYELDKILTEDGMSYFRRKYWLRGLKLTRGSYAHPRNKRKIRTAP